jgi:hypothetical protein
MAEEIVVKEPLNPEMIEEGKRLIAEIERDPRFRLRAALWNFNSESGEWALWLISPRVQEEGTRPLYDEIYDKVAERIMTGSVSLNVRIESDREPYVQTILDHYSSRLSAGDVRIRRARVGDYFVEDAFVYRSPSAASKPS